MLFIVKVTELVSSRWGFFLVLWYCKDVFGVASIKEKSTCKLERSSIFEVDVH